jgi:hypothetical protein
MEIPNTVKVFCWRTWNNILPTKTNIFHKRVADNMKCPCCEFEDETILHVLWECPATRDVWGDKLPIFINALVVHLILKLYLNML